MALHWLFPTPVLQVDLEPDAAAAITTAQGKGREMRTPHPMDWVPLGS